MERATFANINAAERIFRRNTMLPQVDFPEEQINRMPLPRLGYPNLAIRFDLSNIEVLRKNENSRETQILDRGVLTINEIRRSRNLPEVPWGNHSPAANPGPD